MDDSVRLRIHALEQAHGAIVRDILDSIELLEAGLTALRHKEPRVDVMQERAECVVEILKVMRTKI